MIDSGTGLTILGSAIGGAKVVEKLLGPTSEYIGEQLKEWTKKRIENTTRIFQNAAQKIGDDIDKEGRVPPKVLKAILEDGAWSEEKLQVEYFGGVLASSRTGISRDDRGACFTSLISRLSTYQLRTHYLVYQSVKRLFNGKKMNVGNSKDRLLMELFIPYTSYIQAMDFTTDEVADFHNLMSHSIWGLSKEGLIENFIYGPSEYLQNRYKEVSASGILLQPSNLGVELMMWAYGHGQMPVNAFFNPKVIFNNDESIKIGPTYSTKLNAPVEDL